MGQLLPPEENAKLRDALFRYYRRTGERARQLRESKNLSQSEVAHRCGLSDDTVEKVEKGQVPIGGKIVERLAKAIGVLEKQIWPPANEFPELQLPPDPVAEGEQTD